MSVGQGSKLAHMAWCNSLVDSNVDSTHLRSLRFGPLQVACLMAFGKFQQSIETWAGNIFQQMPESSWVCSLCYMQNGWIKKRNIVAEEKSETGFKLKAPCHPSTLAQTELGTRSPGTSQPKTVQHRVVSNLIHEDSRHTGAAWMKLSVSQLVDRMKVGCFRLREWEWD